MFGFTRDARGQAVFAGVPLASFLDDHNIPTPAFVYDLDAIRHTASQLVTALGGTAPSSASAPDPNGNVVAYAVKANSAGTVIRTVVEAGAGADVVSGAEMELVLRCGVAPSKVVMSGVAKSNSEIDLAIVRGIRSLQVESIEELHRIAARAKTLGQRANVALRINPEIRIDSHAHVATGHRGAKFGILRSDLPSAWSLIDATPELSAVGLSTHLGSTLSNVEAYLGGARAVCAEARARREQGKPLRYVNFGGGYGIDYGKGPVPPPWEFAKAARALQAEEGLSDHALLIEPGRAMVGPYCVLVANVVQTKNTPETPWLMLNVGMNDLIRPALYQAHHRIEALDSPPGGKAWRVAGPVCESTDDFGTHVISEPAPSRVVLRDAGAYGFVMSSEYNGRPLAAEAFISNQQLLRLSPSAGVERWIQSRLSA